MTWLALDLRLLQRMASEFDWPVQMVEVKEQAIEALRSQGLVSNTGVHCTSLHCSILAGTCLLMQGMK